MACLSLRPPLWWNIASWRLDEFYAILPSAMQVFWSDEDEAYIAFAADLPGCSAACETETEALERAHQAIALWLEASAKVGNPIPQPSKPQMPWAIGF